MIYNLRPRKCAMSNFLCNFVWLLEKAPPVPSSKATKSFSPTHVLYPSQRVVAAEAGKSARDSRETWTKARKGGTGKRSVSTLAQTIHSTTATDRQTEQPHADHLFSLLPSPLSLPGKLDAELLPTIDSLTPFQSPLRSTNRLFNSGREQGGSSGF